MVIINSGKRFFMQFGIVLFQVYDCKMLCVLWKCYIYIITFFNLPRPATATTTTTATA